MIVNGKQIAGEIESLLIKQFESIPKQTIYFVIFGENKASEQFMNIKSRVAERIGIVSKIKSYPKDFSTEEAIKVIKELSSENIDGIIVQLPLPKQMDTSEVLDSIPMDKDIDLLSNLSIGNYRKGKTDMVPPVANAVKSILESHNIDIENKNILIIGRGRLVGQPVADMLDLLKVNYEIIDINISMSERIEKIKSADIIISGAGTPHMIKSDMVKDGVILIDAGTTEQNSELVGDIDPDCSAKASLFSRTPGGIGPITVVSLFKNLLYKNKNSKNYNMP